MSMRTDDVPDELVVLVDDSGVACGTAPKALVHDRNTPLHLAFSCYVFDASGSLLVTRRASTKSTWPGVWTNSLCGHPLPGEAIKNAVVRRAKAELAITLSDLRLALPSFRYRAVMSTGIVENEICPVFTARCDEQPRPHPDEVAEFEWRPWGRFQDEVLERRFEVSPWCGEQVTELAALSAHPRELTAPTSTLPPAAVPRLGG